MTKKMLSMLVGLMISGLAWAESTSPADSIPPQNPHLSRDAKIKACKAEADQKQLSGDQRNVFVSSCIHGK